jgi:hypothetical protein
MLILVLAAKDLIGRVVKAGLEQVCREMRDAKDVRVRLVENIVGRWKSVRAGSYVLELHAHYPAGLLPIPMPLPFLQTQRTA